MNFLNKMSQDLNESLNPFFKNQTFFKAAKTYPKELVRIIMMFLQTKRVKLVERYSINSNPDQIDFNSLKSDKSNRGLITKFSSELSPPEEFFSAKDSYKGINFPKFVYKDCEISIKISTNSDFFENGHDLVININKDDKKKEVSYKIDLMNSVENVLNDIWNKLEKAIESEDSTDNKKNNITINNKVESDIQQIFNSLLKKTTEIKKGQVIIKDSSPPVEFSLYYGEIYYNNTQYGRNKYHSDSYIKSNSSVTKQDNPFFTIEMKIPGKNVNSQQFINKYPDTKNFYEKYKEYFKYQKDFDESVPEKIYDEESKKYLDRFKIFIRRIAYYGYYPENFRISNSKGEDSIIKFKYSKKLKRMDKSDIEMNVRNFIYRFEESLKNASVWFVEDLEEYFKRKSCVESTENIMRWFRKVINNEEMYDSEKLYVNKLIDQLNTSGFDQQLQKIIKAMMDYKK